MSLTEAKQIHIMSIQQSNQAVYYAHSGKLEDLSDGQTLLDHLSKVGEIAEQTLSGLVLKN